MNQETDQEKLLNAASVASSNILNGSLNLLSFGKTKTTIEVTAADDLTNTRNSLKKGEDVNQIQENLQNSPVAQRIKSKGGDTAQYADTILRRASLDNIAKPQADTAKEQVQNQDLDRQIER